MAINENECMLNLDIALSCHTYRMSNEIIIYRVICLIIVMILTADNISVTGYFLQIILLDFA